MQWFDIKVVQGEIAKMKCEIISRSFLLIPILARPGQVNGMVPFNPYSRPGPVYVNGMFPL